MKEFIISITQIDAHFSIRVLARNSCQAILTGLGMMSVPGRITAKPVIRTRSSRFA